MTRTFNPESYGKLLAEYQPKIITTEQENEQAIALALTLEHRPNRTPEEEMLLELLVTLIEKFEETNKGHGRIEKRSVSISQKLDGIRSWPGLTTVIRVESERQVLRHHEIEVKSETRYYISSLSATAQEFSERIRGYWGVENKVHYVRDVTQGEDKSRIRTTPLPQIFAIARNFTLNLYRDQMFENMAQAQRLCSFGLDTLKRLFRMK